MTVAAHPGEERSRLPALLAAGACIGLALLNWRLFTSDIDISPIPPGGAGEAVRLTSIEALPSDAKGASPTSFPETLARPLFRADRRPAEAKPKDGANQAAQKPVARLPDGLELVGILKDEGGVERALIRSKNAPTGEWVELGHDLDGWRLSKIESGGITFEANGQTQNLPLFPKKDDDAKGGAVVNGAAAHGAAAYIAAPTGAPANGAAANKPPTNGLPFGTRATRKN
jgi:hypothetical protein